MMKLIKKNKKLTLLVALVTLLVMTFLLGVIAYAATPTYDLTMHFDSTMCKVYYKVNDGGRMEMTSGVPCQIIEGSKVVVEIETVRGYTLNGAARVEIENPEDPENPIYVDKDTGVYEDEAYTERFNKNNGDTTVTFSFNSYSAAKDLYVLCTNRTYTVEYVSGLNSTVGAAVEDYVFEKIGSEAFKPNVKTYGMSGLVSPVSLSGYDFHGWEVVQISKTEPNKYESINCTLTGDATSG